MGRDSFFVVMPFGGGEEVEAPAKQELLDRLRPATPDDDDWAGWGELAVASSFTKADGSGFDNATMAIYHEYWYGYGRNIYYPGLLRAMAKMSWRNPQHLQVLVCDQDDEVYRLWVLRNGEFVEANQPGTVVLPGQVWEDNTRLALTDN